MAIPQTTLTAEVGLAQEGQLVFANNTDVESFPAAAETAPGRVCVVNSSGKAALPTALAADVDAIEAQNAALGDASGTSYTFSGLNPARNITITQDTDAAWNATTAVIVGRETPDGPLLREELTITDGGNAVATGELAFTEGTITIPAQASDAPGTIGTGVVVGAFTAEGVSVLDVAREATNYATNEAVPLCRAGQIFVVSEDAATRGGQVFVRVIAGTGESLGAVRSDTDSGDAVPLKGWQFAGSTSTTGQVVLIERV